MSSYYVDLFCTQLTITIKNSSTTKLYRLGRLFVLSSLLVIGISSRLLVYGKTLQSFKDSSIYTMTRSFGKQCYTTLGWHDGGRIAGFFVAIHLRDKVDCIWIDTSLGLKGTHVGYRHYLNQNCFLGGYIGYDSLSGLIQKPFSIGIASFLSCSTRLNLGVECSNIHLGKLTVNLYGVARDPGIGLKAKDYFGISGKINFYSMPFSLFDRIKPFVGVACSWVGLPQNDFKINDLWSMIIGAKYLVNKQIDLEIKYVYDAKNYQWPLNIGCQIRFDKIDPFTSYFRSQFTRPPDRYIPHYRSSIQLRKKQLGNSTGLITAWIEDGLELYYDNNFFSAEERSKADQLAVLEGANTLKIPSANVFSIEKDDIRTTMIGGASKEQLEALWYDQTISKNSLLMVRDFRGNYLNIGILGSATSLMYGIQCTFKEIAETAAQSIKKNIVLTRIVQKASGKNTAKMILIGFPPGIEAEQRRFNNNLLAECRK